MAEPLRIGVIGLGIGQWHIEGYNACELTHVTAICDANPQRLEQVRSKFSIDKAYASHEQLCADPAIDAVSICLPNALHHEVALCALNADKHVLCEKPLAESVPAAQAMADAARDSDRVTMLGMKFRFQSESQALGRLVQQNRLGDIYYGWTSYLRPPTGIPRLGTWFTRHAMAGGGALIDNGVHLLDLLWWLMGRPVPQRVSAATHDRLGQRQARRDGTNKPLTFDVEDFGAGVIHFTNGASILLDNSWASYVGDQTIIGMRLLGTEGGATLWPYSVFTESGALNEPTPPAQSQFEHFARCIIDGTTPLATFDQGLDVLCMIDAMYRSAREQREIQLEPVTIAANDG